MPPWARSPRGNRSRGRSTDTCPMKQSRDARIPKGGKDDRSCSSPRGGTCRRPLGVLPIAAQSSGQSDFRAGTGRRTETSQRERGSFPRVCLLEESTPSLRLRPAVLWAGVTGVHDSTAAGAENTCSRTSPVCAVLGYTLPCRPPWLVTPKTPFLFTVCLPCWQVLCSSRSLREPSRPRVPGPLATKTHGAAQAALPWPERRVASRSGESGGPGRPPVAAGGGGV